jgi:hypothetical protein
MSTLHYSNRRLIMFKRKTETMSISEFMNHSEKPKRSKKLHPAALAPIPLMLAAKPAFAAEGAVTAAATPEIGLEQLSTIFDALVDKAYVVAGEFLRFGAEFSLPAAFIILPIITLISLLGAREFGGRAFRATGMSYVILQILPVAFGILTGGSV